jgi:hypothetical protein
MAYLGLFYAHTKNLMLGHIYRDCVTGLEWKTSGGSYLKKIKRPFFPQDFEVL